MTHARHATTRRRVALGAMVTVLTLASVACDDDADPSNDNVIPEGTTITSDLPSTDQSPITTPAPNPDAGATGGAGSGG